VPAATGSERTRSAQVVSSPTTITATDSATGCSLSRILTTRVSTAIDPSSQVPAPNASKERPASPARGRLDTSPHLNRSRSGISLGRLPETPSPPGLPGVAAAFRSRDLGGALRPQASSFVEGALCYAPGKRLPRPGRVGDVARSWLSWWSRPGSRCTCACEVSWAYRSACRGGTVWSSCPWNGRPPRRGVPFPEVVVLELIARPAAV
jgi:hypothetical protein